MSGPPTRPWEVDHAYVHRWEATTSCGRCGMSPDHECHQEPSEADRLRAAVQALIDRNYARAGTKALAAVSVDDLRAVLASVPADEPRLRRK